ncbi:Uncharacterised protein [Mycobacteroides abscessus subsp. abscessus]|nr:Uncharacterised protein [Mycobacteroides abscessus subsp. abscessus]
MILQDHRLGRPERRSDRPALLQIADNPAVIGVHSMVLIEGTGVLRDGQ